MVRLLQKATGRKKALGAVLLLAMLVSVVVPSGYMPSTAPDGSYTVVICTQDGFRTVTLDANGVEIPEESEENSSSVSSSFCIFGSCITFAPYPAVQLALEALDGSAVTVAFFTNARRERQILGHRNARAPPYFL